MEGFYTRTAGPGLEEFGLSKMDFPAPKNNT